MSLSPIDRLRRVGKLEGVSFLILLFVAMPLKHLADQPLAVTIVGWAHGVLVVWFCWALAVAKLRGGLSFKLALLALVASLLPFGPFVIDHWLRGETVSRP